jgi:isoleucyl-tRNA synthetase
MPLVASAVAALDASAVVAALRAGRTVGIMVGGHDHALDADDLLISMKPLEGYQVEREGSHAVALELGIDEELRAEGWAREIVHAVQAARREAGLEVTDRIVLTLDGDDQLVAAARAYEEYIARETLAVRVVYPSDADALTVEAQEGERVVIDQRELWLGVARA